VGAVAWIVWKIRDSFQKLCEKNLIGEVVVITGAGSGIGRLLALKLSMEHKCRIALWDVNQDLVEKTVEEIRTNGGLAKAYVGDVSDNLKVYELANSTKKDFGRVDILINNAGIVSGKPLLQTPDEHIKKVMDINTTAHFWTVKAFLPDMIERNHGHIVTISSLAGTQGVPGLGDYCASKFGAFGFDECVRKELRSIGRTGVKTTCVCPYYINTGMFEGITPLPFFPILEPDYVVEKIIHAMKRDQAILMLPRLAYLTPIARGILPTSWFDGIGELLNLDKMMLTFRGRSMNTHSSTPTPSSSSSEID